MKDVWLIGDWFLKQIFNTLPAIRNEAVISKQEIPYIYRYYDIYAYFQCRSIVAQHEGLLRLANALIEALNKRNRLPCIIMLFSDKDVLESLGKEYADDNTHDAVYKLIQWMVNFVDRSIYTCKEDQYNAKPGVVNPGEPKLIWIQMIHRNPGVSYSQKRAAFNDMLEEAI